MKAPQYREMSSDELEDKLKDLQKRLFELRTQAVTEKLEDSKAMVNLRREIARIKTVTREAHST